MEEHALGVGLCERADGGAVRIGETAGPAAPGARVDFRKGLEHSEPSKSVPTRSDEGLQLAPGHGIGQDGREALLQQRLLDRPGPLVVDHVQSGERLDLPGRGDA